MFKETKMKKSSLILGSALVAVMVAAAGCDPYVAPNKSQPIVIGAAALDVSDFKFTPYPGDVVTIPFPYPEPDWTWAASAFPGLCNVTSAAQGTSQVCPVTPFPPRTGPAYAPFYLGNNSFSYTCKNGQTWPVTTPPTDPLVPVNDTCPASGTYTAALPTDGIFVVNDVPFDVVTLSGSDYLFVQLRLIFNKLLNGKTIEPEPGIGAAKTATEGSPTFVKVTKQDLTTAGAPEIDVTCTTANLDPVNGCPAGTVKVHYNPNASVSYYGGSIDAIPVDLVLDANTIYRVTGKVEDQQGNSVDIAGHFTTAATLLGAAPKK